MTFNSIIINKSHPRQPHTPGKCKCVTNIRRIDHVTDINLSPHILFVYTTTMNNSHDNISPNLINIDESHSPNQIDLCLCRLYAACTVIAIMLLACSPHWLDKRLNRMQRKNQSKTTYHHELHNLKQDYRPRAGALRLQPRHVPMHRTRVSDVVALQRNEN